MGKFTKLPVKADELVGKETQIEEFIKGALNKPTQSNNSESLPWLGLDNVEKTKGINLRITKADLAKLQYISKNTPYSIQAFCYECIQKAIEEKLNQL